METRAVRGGGLLIPEKEQRGVAWITAAHASGSFLVAAPGVVGTGRACQALGVRNRAEAQGSLGRREPHSGEEAREERGPL